MKVSFGDAMTAVLVLCAGVVTTVAVHREFFAPQSIAAAAPRRLVDTTDLARGHPIGPAGAPVRFVEFSDFECQYCRALDASLRELSRRHPNEIGVVYRHFPLAGHRFAMPAAVAAECADLQGRFEPYAALLFAKQDSLGLIAWDSLAARAGVGDLARFDACRTANPRKAVIGDDMATGSRLGITATPALILGNEMVIGAQPIDSLEEWIRTRLPRAAR